MKHFILVCATITLAGGARLDAVPPLVSGDVPTADKESFELYVGVTYESDGDSRSRQFPADELVYGISDRQEITFEMPYLSQDSQHGFGDVILGTKYMILKESKTLPGIAPTFEWKLRNASTQRGLGTGAYDYDLRVPIQKTWNRFTALANIGYTIIGEPHLNGVTEKRKNVWFASFAQEYEITKKTKLLSELYFETSDEPGKSNRLAADVGFEHKVREDFKLIGSIGKSLREGNKGGPELRVYVGFEWDFAAPWKSKTDVTGNK
jgi:hypothetical protein